VAEVEGLYFLGLPWMTCRASSFIWGVWQDAGAHAARIAARAG
jgi:putative flavoprotein involved in K+ transport